MTDVKRYSFLLLCLIAVHLTAARVSAQTPAFDPCTGGQIYYVAFPDTTANMYDTRFPPRHPESFLLMIYSPVAQQVRIGRPGGASRTYSIGENSTMEIDTREIAVPLITATGVTSDKALIVEAESPIVLYAYLSTHFGCAAFTPVPVEQWGTEHFVAAWPGERVWDVAPGSDRAVELIQKVAAPAEVVIIAAYDSTIVQIEATGPLLPAAGTVILHAGDAYLLQSVVDLAAPTVGSHDIAGTRILSDKPVGVVSGNTRAGIDTPSVRMSTAGNSPKDLMLEWIRPVESHGTEFVVMPTMDELRPRPNADPVRQAEYVRILPSTALLTAISVVGLDSAEMPVDGSPAVATEVVTDTIPMMGSALRYTTSAPAALYHSPEPVVQFNGKTGSGSRQGDSYLSWGSSLVEATPRERWTSFAPFRAPSVQATTKHYLNVVCGSADSGRIYFTQGTSPRQRFPFNRGAIAGTDLVWGSVAVNPGVTYIIQGDSGARFGGYVYGSWRGYELFRPPGFGPLSEYEENTAQMYAFPLASRHCQAPFEPDFLFDIERGECGEQLITATARDGESPGIAFVRLTGFDGAPVNTRMELMAPADSGAFASGRVTEAVVRLTPIDPSTEASATLLIQEKGREFPQRIIYTHQPDPFTVVPAAGFAHIEFLSRGISSGTQNLSLTVTSTAPVTIRDVRIAGGERNFRIMGMVPQIVSGTPVTLEKGEKLQIGVAGHPSIDEGEVADTLLIETGCGIMRFPLSGTVKAPCLTTPNLDFGSLRPGEQWTMQLQICNSGEGRAIFVDSSSFGGGDILSWLGDGFTVSPADIDRLRNTSLLPGRCVVIDVTFTAPAVPGLHTTTARLWSNTRLCSDTSLWSALVDTTSSVDEPSGIGGLSVAPNPANDELAVDVVLTRATDVRIALFDAAGRAVASLDAGRLSAGAHRLPLELSGLPSGIYLLRVGDLTERVVIVR